MTAPDNYRCHQLTNHLSPIGRGAKKRVARIMRSTAYSILFGCLWAFSTGAAFRPLTPRNQIDTNHIEIEKVRYIHCYKWSI